MADIKIPSDSGKYKAGAGDDLEVYNDGSHSYISNIHAGDSIILATRPDSGSTTTAVTIDKDQNVTIAGNLTSDGNVVLGGATAKAWHSSIKPLQLGGVATIAADATNGYTQWYENAYLNTSDAYKYIENGRATMMYHGAGTWNFRVSTASNSSGADAALSWTDALFIDTAGKVGIGTTSPSGELHIKSAASAHADVIIDVTTDDYASGLYYYEAGSAKSGIIHYGDSTNGVEGGLQFLTGGISASSNTRMVIDSSGNVGIGCTPSAPFHIENNADDAYLVYLDSGDANMSDTSSMVALSNNSSMSTNPMLRIHQEQNEENATIGNTGYMMKVTKTSSNTEIFSIRRDGNVAITDGSSDDTAPSPSGYETTLALSAGGEGPAITFEDTGEANKKKYILNQSGTLKIGTMDDNGGGVTHIMLIDSSGQVGIGGAPSSAQLHIHGDMDNTSSYGLKVDAAGSDGSNIAYHAIWVDENGDGCGSITSNSSGNSSAYNTSSDYRLKENEVAISDGITRLNQLKPYRFNWKKSPDYIVDGFFAHEVQEIIPEAVVGEKDAVDKDGNIERQMIDHSKLVPLLVAAVKELSAKVEVLENA